MAYKSILTVATNPDRLALLLGTASKIAKANDGRLDVLIVGVDPVPPAFYSYGDSIAELQIALDQANEIALATESAAKAILAMEGPALRWSVDGGAAQISSLRGLVVQQALYSDLVVLPQPYGHGRPKEAEAVLEAALFEAQAPVLVLPRAHDPATMLGKRVVLAWNQSREAMAAVRHGMPFLIAADEVNIVMIDPPAQGAERSDPGGQLCQMLVRHGVRAAVAVLARSAPRVSDVLLRHLRDRRADLLVMGAYGHSRLREAILGGATRDMLERAEVPILLAH